MQTDRKAILDALYAACSGEAAAYACAEAACALRRKMQTMERTLFDREKPIRRLEPAAVPRMRCAVISSAAALPVFAIVQLISRSVGMGLLCGLAAGAAAFEKAAQARC